MIFLPFIDFFLMDAFVDLNRLTDLTTQSETFGSDAGYDNKNKTIATKKYPY
jgi:hypothetical protein